jgi:DeoR family transcriptional regulator, aga operon transcriptional repressor
MLASARRRVVVADGSKVGRVELARLCGVDEVDLLITDASADERVVAALRETGLEVQIAS